MNSEKGHSICSVLAGCRARRGGGGWKRDEGDIGIRDTLADEVLRAVSTSTAVAGKSGGTDIGEAEGMLANLNELRIKGMGRTYSSLTPCLMIRPERSLEKAKSMKLFSPQE